MSPVDVRVLAIRAEIERDWANVVRQLERARSVDPEAGGPEASLLAFRHFLRHAYAAELDPERLRRNVDCLARAVERTNPSLGALLESLTEARE